MKLELLIRGRAELVGPADVYTFFQKRCVIGRSRCDVWLSDTHCSKLHAVIYEDRDGKPRIRDLNSLNGTYVNGLKVWDAPLKPSDEIRVGKTRLSVMAIHMGNFVGRTSRQVQPVQGGMVEEPSLTTQHDQTFEAIQQAVRLDRPVRNPRWSDPK